jgi:hypothetical protein
MDPISEPANHSPRLLLQRLVFGAVMFAVLTSALIAGLIIRRFAWDQTESIRFTDDINNAFRQGTEALRVGYLNRYDQDRTSTAWYRSGMRMEFDYAPGRLAIAELWTRWVRSRPQIDGPNFESKPINQWDDEFYDRARTLHQQYQLCKPMLMVNLTGEILSAIAMFLLVRRYTSNRQAQNHKHHKQAGSEVVPRAGSSFETPGSWAQLRTGVTFVHRFFRQAVSQQYSLGVIAAMLLWAVLVVVFYQCGLPLKFTWQLPALLWLWFAFPANRATLTGIIAALFFWFDPALIWNAHCWPQWDSWVLPFFLWAIVAASWDCWFIAGALIAAGAMFKGQILFGAPVFLLWPTFQGRWLAMLRWILGLLASTAAITAVWLLRMPGKTTPSSHFIPGEISTSAVAWVICMAAAFALMIPLLRLRWVWYAKLPVVILVAGLIGYQFCEDGSLLQRGVAVIFACVWAAIVMPMLWPSATFNLKLPAIIGMLLFITWGLLQLSSTGLLLIDMLLIFGCGFAALRTLPRSTAWKEFAIILACPLLAGCLWEVGRFASIATSCLFTAAIMLSGSLLMWAGLNLSRSTWRLRLPLGLLLTALILWPLLRLQHGPLLWAVVAAIAVGLIVFYAPRRALSFTAAGWITACLFLCIPLFDGSSTWFYTGIAFPTHHFEAMASGANDNLADILEKQWGWQTMDPALTLPKGAVAENVAAFITSVDPKYTHSEHAPVTLPLKYLLVSIWILAVVLCSIGAAVHDQRRDPQFLIAIAAPWIAMFAVMAQMHQRYLLWGASLSAGPAALNPGYALLHLLLSLIAMSQEMDSMLGKNPRLFHTPVGQLIQGWHPGIGWAVLLTAIIFVYNAVRPIRSRNAG